MRTRLLLVLVFVLAVAGAGTGARAHECTYDGPAPDTGRQVECHESPVVPNWRDGNYVPLFDLADRDDEDQRRDAQRWREECAYYDETGRYHHRQECVWLYGGTSLFSEHGEDPTPNELHTGVGATHCFLAEAAHQCEDHDKRNGEGVHDKHGGSIYVDICATENPESKYCDDGARDTQAGVTIMDHNPCGTIVPIVACTDEYHVVRPLDSGYTEEQMRDSAAYTEWILYNPVRYLCGKPEYNAGVPWCPSADEDEATVAPGASIDRARAATAARTGALPPTRPVVRGTSVPVMLDIDGASSLASSSPVSRDGRGSDAATWLVIAGLLGAAIVRARNVSAA